MDITLEKVDKVRERTGVSYSKAKEALEVSNGDVLEAIIFLEKQSKDEGQYKKTETIEELKIWLKDLINKGNVTRIKVSKDGCTCKCRNCSWCYCNYYSANISICSSCCCSNTSYYRNNKS